jgi:predicted nucleotidyltransferase
METTYAVHADPVIQALIAEAAADPDVIGLVVTGSRAVGAVTAESDYDVAFVVTDEALDRYERESRVPARGATVDPPIATNDIWHQAPRTLQLDRVVPWMLPAWAESRVLYDRTGETARIVDRLRLMPKERAQHEAATWYDAYLNGLYRSLKSWRRGNVLGGRLEAAETADYLLHTLFALERRWRPYSSRMALHLHELTGQGWQPDELRVILLDMITTGAPRRQQQVARRVVALLRERGFGHVYDGWEGQIDMALTWMFD